MGGHSDSDDDSYRRRKKKKKRSSRSRSRSSDSSYSSSRSSRKHRKSKKKTRRRSRSASRDRRRSRSPRRRSRSHSWERSRSTSRRSSRERYSSRRSRSRSRSRRRSRSPRSRRSRSRSRDKVKVELPDDKDPSKIVPGWDQMSSAQQAEARLQLALKAAANVDENLREQGLLSGVRKSGAAVGSSSNSPLLTFDERMHRNKAIQDIEDAGFAQTAFKSSRAQRAAPEADVDDAHDAAIFGGAIPLGAAGEMPILSFSSQPLRHKDEESLMHPNLYVSAEEKMDRWIAKLKAFRRQKLEGKVLK